MKNISFLLLFCIFSFTSVSCAQPKVKDFDKGIISPKTLTQTKKLAATAKVWGFLKYYHPQVAKGKFNWDEQLFTVLDKVEAVETSEELSAVFSNWIGSLGEVEACTKCFKITGEEEFLKNFDLSWINNGIFSKELSEKLRYIERNRVQDYQHYVTAAPTGNIIVQNEPEYEDFRWEEKELRLLTLFRYWNHVEYFFPYKYQMDRDWDETLEVLIPKFLYAQKEQEYHLAMLELATSIDDSHSFFITDHTNRYFGYYWAPVELQMIDNNAVVTGMYDRAKAEQDDWQIGDILTAVNGVPVAEILKEDKKYLYGSNDPARYRNVEISLLNGSGPSAEIEVLRDGESKKKHISRYLKTEFNPETPDETKWKLLEDNVGYVNMGIIENDDVKRMFKDLKNTKAIIFDIRNYPNGTLYAIGTRLNTESKEFVKFTNPDLNYPGKYRWTQPYTIGKKNARAYKGKVILLVNEWTQSHAEFTAMALQTAPDVTVIGSQTSGADGNVSDVSMLGKFKTYISGIGVFYPDGRETQRVGIIPDIEVKPTLEGVKENRDEVLEKAVEVAQGKKV